MRPPPVAIPPIILPNEGGVTYNYFAPPIVEPPELDSVTIDAEQMEEISRVLASILGEIQDLEIGGGSGLSTAELEEALEPINDDLDQIINSMGSSSGGRLTETDKNWIREELDTIRTQLSSIDNATNVELLQDQIDYLIRRLDRVEAAARTRGR